MKRFKQTPPKTDRICDFPGCCEAGNYKAPKDKNLRSYYWFCLKHVSEYNKNWDFYAGLSPEEIEKHLQNDVTWQRPTWKLGQSPFKNPQGIKDPFSFFSEEMLGMNGGYNPPRPHREMPPKISQALDFMELSLPLSLSDLKKQYKKLAKKYHPDANKKSPEEATIRFHRLSESYHLLLTYLEKNG